MMRTKIHIIFDLIIFDLQRNGGISVYWFELLKRIISDSDFEERFYIYKNVSHFFYEDIERMFEEIPKSSIVRKGKWNSLLFRFIPRLSFDKKYLLFHSSYLSTCLSFSKFCILTVHDLGHERGITQSGIKKWVHVLFKYLALRRAKGIICVSEFTKKELLEIYPFCNSKEIKVVYNGVDQKFRILNVARPLIPGKYILYVGTRFSYKNFNKTVNCVGILKDYKLVIVGGGELTLAERLFLSQKLGDRYVHNSDVSTEVLNNYYNFAICLLYLSIYEGFGIPIVEAMKSGCPYISFTSGSIPEISQDAGILLSPCTDESTIVSSILSLENLDYRAELVERGRIASERYSWDICYSATKDFYIHILK